ncbi:cell division protein DivIC [Ureibacillus xyleni]|uniref:Cell division protein DivIC n=1 Tax=Ureibacillus xyleni TaxID=614648 RepID=A0A285TRT0_9BACL|nr:septum formation initiator family protein [Ureibacillus xyleni]SOC26375.1 cell division protein DivIC [Ureibacillus xyleni]
MAKRQDQIKTQQNNVRTLENDYVRSSEYKANYSKQKKIRFRRRMFVFGIIAFATLFFLIKTNIHQNERLAQKEQQKEEVLAQLEEVKERQELLNLQIAKLEDDEYIAKLARKEFFLSEDGEIIFTIPDEGESKGNE